MSESVLATGNPFEPDLSDADTIDLELEPPYHTSWVLVGGHVIPDSIDVGENPLKRWPLQWFLKRAGLDLSAGESRALGFYVKKAAERMSQRFFYFVRFERERTGNSESIPNTQGRGGDS